MRYKVCIIGLGLMGASLAKALKGFRNAEIVGVDTDKYTRDKALYTRTVSAASHDAVTVVGGANLIIFCVYPHHIPEILESCSGSFAEDAVISDICGVKKGLYEKLMPIIPGHVDYVGIHPMAGRERDGIDNADAALFKDTGFIICPLSSTKKSSIQLMSDVAHHIGASRLAVTPIELHDEIIAYTSDLMHISAAALCMDYHPNMTLAYTAGAFRDCTRVGDINADAWAELLMANSANTIASLDRYIARLTEIRESLRIGDEEKLNGLLELGGDNKRLMLEK
ncbi:prephenate dehydrogenase [Clostridia bacterium]|nr:prephenate dehydrogenase [Clostridia bacterium]